MALKSLGLLVLFFFMLTTVSSAQESESLTITDMKVEPSTVSSGGKVVISCQVSHPLGPMHIEKVAATTFYGNWVTAYPELYDDGTNGDVTAEDGIYSLEIKAPESVGEVKIMFSAVDTDKNEIESEPIILRVE